ncbi:MAG: hypothetical protein FJX74_25210 [Armatimonadetes bacterium]|nr:hypothetical protein [Armatimonadota bacterium]
MERMTRPAPSIYQRAARVRVGAPTAVLFQDDLGWLGRGMRGAAFNFRGRRCVLLDADLESWDLVHVLLHECEHHRAEDLPELMPDGSFRNVMARPHRLPETEIEERAGSELDRLIRAWSKRRPTSHPGRPEPVWAGLPGWKPSVAHAIDILERYLEVQRCRN